MARAPNAVIRRSADEVKNYRMLRKIIGSSLLALTAFLAIVYLISLLYSNSGSFTVSVMKFDKVKYSLTLCEEPSFANPTARLDCNAAEEITNIAGESIPADVDSINGQHNGINYIAYTFYCKNNGQLAYDCEYEVYITNMTKELDKAVRVRLYVNGVANDYARTRTDGKGAEPGTIEFQTVNTVTKGKVMGFNPGDIAKFTVVIWLEGNDPDCVDNKLGGEFKIDMNLAVSGVEEIESDA